MTLLHISITRQHLKYELTLFGSDCSFPTVYVFLAAAVCVRSFMTDSEMTALQENNLFRQLKAILCT